MARKYSRENMQRLENAALKVISKHVGRENYIDMGDLYYQVFGKRWHHKINDSRPLREVITSLRKQGVPICSTPSQVGGGYYMASTGSEREDYCRRLNRRAMHALVMEARIRKMNLPQMLQQMALQLESEGTR